MITKYVTGGFSNFIEKVEIERETESSVWIGGNRKAKESDWKVYHETWEGARDLLIKKARMHENACQGMLDSARIKLNRVSQLSKRECE